MELRQDSEPVAAGVGRERPEAREVRAALMERLRQEHLRAHPQQDEAGGYRPQLPLEELRLRIPTSYMQPVKRT